jgi:hypothetical protein
MLTMLPPPAHGGYDRLAAVPDALDVHGHRGVPLGFADRVETTALEAAEKRRIVNKCVNAAERVERHARRLHGRGPTRNVELGADRGALFAPHELECLRAVIDIGDHHAGAEAGEISRIFPADAARGAGDDDDFSFEVHASLSVIASA